MSMSAHIIALGIRGPTSTWAEVDMGRDRWGEIDEGCDRRGPRSTCSVYVQHGLRSATYKNVFRINTLMQYGPKSTYIDETHVSRDQRGPRSTGSVYSTRLQQSH